MLYNKFEKHLSSLEISSKSLKNYKSDISHFLTWAKYELNTLGTYIENLDELIPFFDENLAHEYKNFMTNGSMPRKTINRRLSTLRHLSKFLVISQLIDVDFMANIQNITDAKRKPTTPQSMLIKNFISHLEVQKVSKNTIKNYLSDIEQFLKWYESYI